MQADGFEIRSMAPGEVELALGWAAGEGWNPGLEDGPAFYASDPAGFLLGLENGEPVACISAVAYDETYGFLGFYIVKPEFRGRGLGLRIWARGMEHLGERNVGLDAVPAQQDNYRKSGFAPAYRNIRFEGLTGDSDDAGERGPTAINAGDIDAVAGFERHLFPAPRQAFLARWLTLPQSHALGLSNDGRLEGYGVIRPCRSGYKIGPLFANEETGAERLLRALLSRAEPGRPVFIDVPELNPRAMKLAEGCGMKYASETVRMYNRGEPKLELEKVFGVTTLELG